MRIDHSRHISPSFTHRHSVALMVIVFVTGATGCGSYYRLNHWHSEGNQKLAQDALDQFSSETDRRSGQLATELKNLSALTTFERIGAQHRITADKGDLMQAEV